MRPAVGWIGNKHLSLFWTKLSPHMLSPVLKIGKKNEPMFTFKLYIATVHIHASPAPATIVTPKSLVLALNAELASVRPYDVFEHVVFVIS